MGHGMMGRGSMMGPGSMMVSRHPGMMMRMLFALMDSHGDGTISIVSERTLANPLRA
jgi:hypothetical protein